MARVNVYIPDELWSRVRERKADLNLSQLVQNTLRAELQQDVVQPYPLPEPPTDLDAEIDVNALRKRFHEEHERLYREGYEDGIQCAPLYTYAELLYYSSINWRPDEISKGLGDARHEKLETLHPDQHDPTQLAVAAMYPAHGRGRALVWAQGFAHALRRVWELATSNDIATREPPAREPRTLTETLKSAVPPEHVLGEEGE